eukprot:scaffold1666_cov238-Chaetoceros_neogracile.AAC.1
MEISNTTTTFVIPGPEATLPDEVEFLCVRTPHIDAGGGVGSRKSKDRRLIVKLRCKSADNVTPEEQFRKAILFLFMHHPVKLLPKNTTPELQADGHSCALDRTFDQESFLFLPKTRKELQDVYFWDLRFTGNKGSNTEMLFQIETEMNISDITRHEDTRKKFRANNFTMQHIRVEKCMNVRNVGVLVGIEPAMLDVPHLTQEIKHLLGHKYDIDCYSHGINMGVNLINDGTTEHQKVSGQFIAVRTTDNPEEVFEALGLALMDPEKTSRTVTAGLQIMPMGPSAVFEEAALITGIFNHNKVVSQLTRVAIHQIYNIDTPFELSKDLQIKFRLGTTNNEIAVTTFRYLFIDAAHQCYQGEGVSPIKGLKKEVRGRMDVICEDTRADECAQFIDAFLEVMKEELGENELAELVGVFDSKNSNKHPRREGQFVKNTSGSTVLQALRDSLMSSYPYKGTIVIAPPPHKKPATARNHFRKVPRQQAEYRARAPVQTTKHVSYADMAKAASDIPTPKPVHNPYTKQTKTPESALATKSPESAQAQEQVVPFTQATQSQEIAHMAASITDLVTTFNSQFNNILVKQNALDARQANMEKNMENRQKANETEQAEKNRQMLLQMSVSKGAADSRHSAMEQRMEAVITSNKSLEQRNTTLELDIGSIASNMAMLIDHMKLGPARSVPSTTGNQVSQISGMTGFEGADDNSFMDDPSNPNKRKNGDNTNHVDTFHSQVAADDPPSTQEEQVIPLSHDETDLPGGPPLNPAQQDAMDTGGAGD